jgi:energy-coupling factor transporter ATP-binding protein EcfA2
MFCYWFRYTCLLILSTETNEDFSRQVAVEYGLQFARLHDEIQHAGSEALAMAMTTLDREYGLMRSLLDRSGAGEEAGFERTLLGANYFALRTWFVRQEIGKIIVGQQDVVDGVLICLLAGGHVLLEGVPGLGKTTLLRTLSRVLHLKYSRIQFTPDLMPADIVGSMIMETDERGHRASASSPAPSSPTSSSPTRSIAPPRKPSPLCSKPCRSAPSPAAPPPHVLEDPFLVMATQNPIEMEGTYPLPEAQLDRFLMKILVPTPREIGTARIVDLTMHREEIHLDQVVDRATILELKTVCAARCSSLPRPGVRRRSRHGHAARLQPGPERPRSTSATAVRPAAPRLSSNAAASGPS